MARRAQHARLLAACWVVLATIASTAVAAPTAKLSVSLIPERLGHGTTIKFGFVIRQPGSNAPPPPMTRLALYYPTNFGIVTSQLGTATCSAQALELHGVKGCPSQSLLGYGTATAEIAIEGDIIEESAITAVLMAPFHEGEIALQFYLEAFTPLLDYDIFPGVILPARIPYAGALTVDVPLIEGFTDGPDVSLVRLRSTIGPLGITYYQHTHGQFVGYTPEGILLPRSCPHGGFPFKATFAFADGSTTTARKTVRCPRA